MKKVVVPIAILSILLILGTTSLAEGLARNWWTEFTSDVFTWPDEGLYTYTYKDQGGGTVSYTVEVTQDAPEYQGTVLLRPWSIRIRSDEPGLSCMEADPPRIRPDQPARFHIAWLTDEPMSHQDAEALFDTLSYTVSWDGGAQTVSLARQTTHPYLDQAKLYDMTCLWTVRP